MNRRSLMRTITLIAGSISLFILTATPAAASWHVVQAGDTLWLIGQQYGVDAAVIAEANGVTDSDYIVIGQELWIPDESGEAPNSGGAAVVHVVQAGETLASIAAQYGVDTLALATANAIEAPYLIYPGEEITVPYAELPDGEPPMEPAPAEPEAPGTLDPDIPFFDRDTVRSAVIDLATAYGWDPYLILSLAWQESTWDQRALSPSGAVGVMQLMPATADWAGPALVGHETDYVYSAWDNIETGIAYLSQLRVITGSDYLALASYFQGLASVERDGILPATREYALNIIQSRDLFASGALP